MRVFTLIFATFFINSVYAADFCSSNFVNAHIKKMIASKLPPLLATSEKVGLPHTDGDVSAGQGTIHLQSDLGLSVWTGDELKGWQNLAPLMDDPAGAKALLEVIGATPDYCPPGILPALCNALRESLAARREAMHLTLNQPRSPDDGIFGLGPTRDLIYYTEFVHHQRGALRFSWGTDVRYYPYDIAPHNAIQTLRVLARETLIRHLQFTSLDGRTMTGAELPLESRLILATVPMIVPLSPFFHVHPLDLPGRYIVGSGVFMEDLTLVDIPLKDEPSLKGFIDVTLDIDKPPLRALDASIVTTWIEGQGDEVNFELREKLSQILLAKINKYGEEFRREMGLKQSVSATLAEWDMGTQKITLKGLGRLHQVLFYYYLAEKLASE